MSDAERPSGSNRIAEANRQHFNEGQHVFREGEVGDSAFIVVDGTVAIYRLTEEGEQVLATLAKGAMFQKKMDGLDPFTRGLIKILADNVRNAQK